MQLSEIMTKKPAAIAADASLDEAMALMDERNLRHLPVLRGRRVVGMISDRDLLETTGWLPPRVREVLDAPAGSVAEFMDEGPFTAAPEDSLESIASRLAKDRLGCVPVVKDHKLVGVVTEVDVLRAFVDACAQGRIAKRADAKVSAHMSAEPATCGPRTALEKVLDVMHAGGIRHMPVVLRGRLVGIVSDRDLRLAIGRGALSGAQVKELMTPDPATIAPAQRLSEAAQLLARHKFGALPVVEDGKLAGILSSSDVLAACARCFARS